MVKKYAELYLDARRALLPTEGQFASNVARELICAASGKTAEQLISDRDLYASEEICELAQSFVRRRVAGEPMPYILGEWDFYGMTLTVTPDVLIPRAEIEGEMGEAFVGLQARLMSQALRKLAGTVSKTNCIVIFINQLRMKIGVMYGNPETTTGGNALKFYSSVRLDVRKIEAIKSGTEIVGNRTRVKVIKNKCAPPFREAVFDIMYGEGISRFGELLDIAVTLELVNKSGSWFSVGDERIGQGRDNAKQYIADHPELAAELEARVRAHLMEVQNSRIKQPAAPAKPVDVSADDFDAE